MFRICLGLSLCLVLLCARAELRGDPAAIEMAEAMIDTLGGAEAWRNARSLYIVEKSRTLNGDGVIATFWRDLEVPRERQRLNSPNGNVIEFWWDERGVSRLVNGEPYMENLPPDIHEQVMTYWPGEIYVMFHRLASGAGDLRLEKNEDNSFTALGKQDRPLGTFWVNRRGELYRWRHADGTEHIYGPLRRFGDIQFPDWGTLVDGTWSFYYVEVRASADPPDVDFTPFSPAVELEQ